MIALLNLCTSVVLSASSVPVYFLEGTPLKPTDILGQRGFISLFTLLCLGPAILA